MKWSKIMSMVCREEECEILLELLKSSRPEFLAIYGRRRVGKTFLIRNFFEDKSVIFFNSTGSKKGKLAEQIQHFVKIISEVFCVAMSVITCCLTQDDR